MNKGEKSEERNIVFTKVDQYNNYKDLPLVSTGCDSYASWDPHFKHLSPVLDTGDITTAIMDMLPHKKWQDEHLVITGGEPLLGWQKQYAALLEDDRMRGLKEITFETNGTQELNADFRHYLLDWTLNNKKAKRRGKDALTFSVSPKLSVSGEKWEDAICPDIVASYDYIGNTYLKFVVATKEDAEEAEQAVNEYRKAGFAGHVYLMPLGGVESLYTLNNKTVALLAMEKGWRYSDRLQIPLFKNAWGT
jgi:organic radical activating enzyme